MQAGEGTQVIGSRMQNLTHRVTRMLADKYSFNDTSLNELQQQPSLRQQDVEQALDRSDKMSTKLKLIRTMLGYEHQSHQRKHNNQTIAYSQDVAKEDRGLNLKQFVLSMRKKTEFVDKYFGGRKSVMEKINALEPENPSLQEYSQSSLKYIHSFLPHQTLLDHLPRRSRFNSHSPFISLSPSDQATQKSVKKLSPSSTTGQPSVGIFRRLKENNKEKTLEKDTERSKEKRNANSLRKSRTYLKAKDIGGKSTEKSHRADQDIFGNIQEFTSVNFPTAFDIYPNRNLAQPYRAKHHKQLSRSIRAPPAPLSPTPTKQLLPIIPTIRSYLPKAKH